MSSGLPTLSENRFLRFFTVTALYMAQGIVMGVIIISLPAVLAAEGLTATQVGSFVGLVMLPWSFKILFAPLMDRFTVIAMGRRRPWILVGIIVSAIGYFGMGSIQNPTENLPLLIAMGMVAVGCSALMDVSVDGMVVDILPTKEQALANGLMWGGKVLGTAITAWASGWMYKNVGISETLYAAGLLTLAFALFPLLIRERSGERLLPWTTGQASEETLKLHEGSWLFIGKGLLKVFLLPTTLWMALLGATGGSLQGFLDAMLPVLTVQELQWQADDYSNIGALSQLISGLIGMVLGGWLANLLGYKRAVTLFLSMLLLANAAAALAAPIWETRSTIVSIAIIHTALRTLSIITFFSIAMALCWKKIAASQFAMYMIFANFGFSSGSILFGQLSQVISFSQMFYVMGGICFVGIFATSRIHIDKHSERLTTLDRESSSQIS